MSSSDVDLQPPLPSEPTLRPGAATIGCVAGLGLAFLLLLYLGLFFVLLLDGLFGWGVWTSFDEQTQGTLEAVYFPLIWLVNQFMMNLQ